MTLVIENGEPVMCGECRTHFFWVGKGKRAVKLCNCALAETPEPENPGRRKCSKKGTKAKGDRGERELVKWLEAQGWIAHRTAGSGAHGSRTNESAFACDVRAKSGDLTIRFEAKRHASIAGVKTLNKLRAESEILWVQEDFQEPHIFAPASALADIFALAAEAKAFPRDNRQRIGGKPR